MKVLVDAKPRRGRFIVTGSVRGDVDVQTLPGTGRVVPLEMHGLTEREIERRSTTSGWFQNLLRGEVGRSSTDERLADYVRRALRSGFPESALTMATTARARWLTAYVDQLVTRDAEGVDGADCRRSSRS